MLAGLVRGFAQNVDQYADQLEDKTVNNCYKVPLPLLDANPP